jgi:predicted phage terminase large subunit-like protein
MEGDYFQWKWLNTYRKLPPLQYLYQAWDFAVSEKQLEKEDPDYSVCATVGIDHSGRYYLVDLWMGRENTATLIDVMIAQHRKHSPRIVWGEQGVIEKAIKPFFIKRCQELGYYFVLDGVKPGRSDKIERATAIRGVMASGAFHIPEAHKHIPDIQSQLTSFPRGRHDDIVDALAYIGMQLQLIKANQPGFTPAQTTPRPNAPVIFTGSDLTARLKELRKAQTGSGLHIPR